MKKKGKKINPVIIAALILVGGFFLYKLVTYTSCIATGYDSKSCTVLTFFGRAN
jgi:hypothetical protein